MDRAWYTRLILVIALLVVATYYAAPSVIYFTSPPEDRRSRTAMEERIPDWMPDSRLNLGIDLQGGLHLVMGVDTEKAVQDRADRVADEILDAMQEAGKPLESAARPGPAPELELVLKSESDLPQLQEVLKDWSDTWEERSRSGRTVRFGMKPAFESQVRDDTVAQALKTLRNRIDAYGVTEPEIRRRGGNSIMIQLAGLTAEEIGDVKEDIIGRTAQLEFKMVDETSTYFEDIAQDPDRPDSISVQMDQWRDAEDAIVRRPYLESPDREALRAFLKKHAEDVPPNRVVGVQEFKASELDEPLYRTWLLERRTPLTGDSLTNATVAFDSEKNEYYVAMEFDRRGADVFERLTTNNVKRKMAIVLDDVVDSAPVIQGPIPNGRASITLGGSFKTQQEVLADANALALVLKAGALPAPVFPQEERTVGATLGDDAVEKGKMALGVALMAIVVLMVVYYRVSGAIGLVATGSNLLMLFAALSALGATLTLPGIAGLALTVGMAVDANIIQFERIREELRAGKPPRAAVDAGFGKAFSAIFDANVTTLLACIVLWQYGSGPIRGFATTLGFGVLINTFTAVVIPKLIYDYLLRGVRLEKVSI